MQKNQVGTLLNKQQYQSPNFVVTMLQNEDIVTTSGVDGQMTWSWDGEWNQDRGNTFVG